MTAEELKEKIQFASRPGQRKGTTVIVASLNIISEHFLNDDSYPEDNSRLADAIKEDMREEIMRCIYGLQHKEFYEAIQEFISWHYPVPEAGDPWTGPTMSKASAAREKLLKLARYQPHSTDEKKTNQLLTG